jgi:hypothetical protein
VCDFTSAHEPITCAGGGSCEGVPDLEGRDGGLEAARASTKRCERKPQGCWFSCSAREVGARLAPSMVDQRTKCRILSFDLHHGAVHVVQRHVKASLCASTLSTSQEMSSFRTLYERLFLSGGLGWRAQSTFSAHHLSVSNEVEACKVADAAVAMNDEEVI